MIDERKLVKEKSILEILKEKILIIDGAMGTMLQKNGLKSGDCPEAWNIEHPDIIKKIHTSYLEAGADIILTNTFGANGVKLKKVKQDHRLVEINQQAAILAKEAADDYISKNNKSVFIAGSIGPTGEILEPCGDLTNKDAYEGYSKQVQELVSAGVDLFILETFYNLDEIKIALKAVKDHSDLVVFSSMTFDDNLKTIYGISPEKAVESLFEEGSDGVGANCGSGPEVLYKVLYKMREMTDAPLLVEPNAGVPYIENKKVIYPFIIIR